MSKEKTVLSHPEILELIPHRPPFLLIDRVEEIIAHKSARGIKAISSTEPHLAGHFPGHPIMPGVLIIEAMAQTAGVLSAYSMRDETQGQHVYFTSIDKVKFKSPARPGDVLYLDVSIEGHRGPLYKFSGTASIEGKITAVAEFSAMMVEPGR